MVKHTQAIRRQFADELFEFVWPFCKVAAERVDLLRLILLITKVRMFKIERICISIFHYVVWSQLLLLYFPKVVRMNTSLNDA